MNFDSLFRVICQSPAFVGIITLCLLLSCTNKSSIPDDVPSSGEALAKIDFTEKVLLTQDYSGWLKKQRGITFDETENDSIRITMCYKPLAYETAISGASDSTFEEMQKLKSGNHYIRIQWLDKNQSVVRPTDKKKIFKQIQSNLFIIQDKSDTLLYNSEIFSAVLLNQPNEILIIAPNDSAITSLSCVLKGKSFGLRDLKLSITEKQLKTFPGIKL